MGREQAKLFFGGGKGVITRRIARMKPSEADLVRHIQKMQLVIRAGLSK